MEEKKPVIVIADTHLGLRPRKVLGIDLQSETCEPAILSGFLNWLVDLEEKGSCILPLAATMSGEPDQMELKPPGTLVLLGDILELWDSSQRAVEMCGTSILQTLSKLRCEKVYVLGNHDHPLSELAGSSYPSGPTPMLLTTPVFPPEEDGTIEPMEMDDAAYLFVHGQQFDRWFVASRGLDQFIGVMRDGAVAFGQYSKWLALAFVAALMISLWNQIPYLSQMVSLLDQTQYLRRIAWFLNQIPRLSSLTSLATVMLAFVAIPWMIMTFARAGFNRVKSRKHDKKGAIEGFEKWWSNWARPRLQTFRERKRDRHISVIYGHTHLADVIERQEMNSVLANKVQDDVTLINIPAWVHDTKIQYQDVLRAMFLYIHDKGYEFFGWDWEANTPRHISKEDVRRRIRGEATDDMLARLASAGWSSKMQDKWRTPLVVP